MNKRQKKIMRDFKKAFEKETGERIDFRKHGYLDNQYGLSPTYSYEFAKKVVPFTYSYFQKLIDEGLGTEPNFLGWEYNLEIAIDGLRVVSLQGFIKGFLNRFA